ncbi:MAG: hypothetical protein NC432_05060 [Roseburia sp.]|nr:hypothetical protein [Roseburia sp.]MCM1098533.1 hypothetical protein [Ruminococcus flavefaciens]
MSELRARMGQLQRNSPRLRPDEASIYSDPIVQQLYLLKFAYAYGFEYCAMCGELTPDFAERDEISVVSLGCGTMLDYWALAYILDEKKITRPAIRYHGIDAVKWDHNLETEVRPKDKQTFQFSQERFEDFLERRDDSFLTSDVYFLPKSISEFSDRCDDGKSAMELMLNRLSEVEKDSICFCISLRKSSNGIATDDVGKVQRILDQLEEKAGFHIKTIKCIADTEKTIHELKENGLRAENIKLEQLGKTTRSGKTTPSGKKGTRDKYIWETDTAKKIGGYPPLSAEDPMISYLQSLNAKCSLKSREPERHPCEGCGKYSCGIQMEQTMRKTMYVCDLVIKLER